MAEDDKPGTNLASSGVVVAALAAIGVYYFHREAPLVDLRPVDLSFQEYATSQTVDARLWQDPFAAVEKSRTKSNQRDLEKQCEDNPALDNPGHDRHCKSPWVKDGTQTLILGVTVSGAPYQEDAEQRRRTRYAVIAGLQRAGFVPKDARHLDYFVWKAEVRNPSPAPLPLDKFVGLLPVFPWHTPSLEYVSPSEVLGLPQALGWPQALQPQLLAGKMEPHRDGAVTGASTPPSLVPFEQFEKPPMAREGKSQTILVLWLKEEALKNQPLQKLSSLIEFITGGHFGKVPDIKTKIIGPHSSDTLKDMVGEVRNLDVFTRAELMDVQFYAYAASAPDRQLLNKAIGTVRTYFDNDFDLRRTLATDDTLAYGIAAELRHRHVDPSHKPTDHIALISEWDTVYGQTLPQAVERQFHHIRPGWHSQTGSSTDPSIYKFTYLRGLDGFLPAAESKEGQKDKATASEDRQDFFKIETDAKTLERPIGESQFDYLRRISEHLSEIDENLRKKGPDNKIRAIGILGSDVFDKLLILRALRPAFPEALFFTTDFDEAFTIKSELPFTRNLLISSSFGPNLSDRWQGGIPFFRDTYQTSAFLATLSALGDHWNIPNIAKISGSRLADQLRIPRIFEIGRTGHVLPFIGKAAPPTEELMPSNTEEQKACAKSLSSCNPGLLVAYDGYPLIEGRSESENDFQPPPDELFPTYETNSRETLAWGFAVGAFLGLALLCFAKAWRKLWVEVSLGALGLAAGSFICFHWEAVARSLTESGNGEPLVMLEGVSVWPTILLRGVGIVLSLYFVWCVLRSLHGNLKEIAAEMELKPEPAPLWEQFTGIQEDVLTLWKTLTGVFDRSRKNDHSAQSLPLNVEAAWQAYVARERFWPRCIRAALYTAGMFLFFVYVLVPMFGKPITPARGELALSLYWWTTRHEVILMQFLTFFVFDATLFCLLFVNKLRAVRSEWPEQTLGVYNGRLRLQTKHGDDSQLVHDWIDLDFVAKRTRCIGALIYFPFVLIALLILSRSTVFANYAPSLTILIAQGISLAVVFACAIMLWWAAKTARDTAKQNLTDGIIRAKDCEGNAYFAGQLESLILRIDQLREGAFGPLTQQPLIKALLFPLSSVGWIALIENGMFPGV